METCTERSERKRPYWIRTKLPIGDDYRAVKDILRSASLHTVCEEAKCPNLWECFGQHTATFLILGNVCTRRCMFCAVTKGTPSQLDTEEPQRVALAVQKLGLKYAVITSVTRDDLPDGGAGIYAETIKLIREYNPACLIEALIPDFGGSIESLKIVIAKKPDTLNHNLETVPRLYSLVRPNAIYKRSLELLKRVKEILPNIITKSGLMLGLGEEWDEVIETMSDLRRVNCDILTLGQYLSPRPGY
ncbi:MAG: lipoyl synthase, partial [Candidatus Brocadiales bacterium]